MKRLMKDLTVKQLAAISGVTVRTLHHYDEIGLLAPAHIGANGYRYYGRAQLLRLQRILFHRELGAPLADIAALLVLEGEDQVGVLLRHREKLEAERQRYRVLIETIDRTVADIQGGANMTNEDLYKGFSAEKQTGYEAWLIEQHGAPMEASIAQAKTALASVAKPERTAMLSDLQQIEEALADALQRGADPASDHVDGLVLRHRAWVARMWGKPCTLDAYAGLADLYLSHADFVKRYELIAPGFAIYLAAAMKAHAVRA
jgi:DNA-binding transcriptional MerR regulator